LLAFGLLFFFLNHAIESTVIPLELIFEHRNYLPSLFIFLPIAATLQRAGAQGFGQGRRRWAGAVLMLTVLMVVGFGAGAHWRNRAWLTEKSLWEDACRKAPLSARAHHNLAWSYYHRAGLYQEALKHYKKALQLRAESDRQNFPTLINVAAIYVDVGDFDRATVFYQEALKIAPSAASAAFGLAKTLTAANRDDAARVYVAKLRMRFPENAAYMNLEGFMRLKSGQPREALTFFEQSIHLDPGLYEARLNQGVALGLVGELERGRTCLLAARRLQPDDPMVLLALIDNCLKSGKALCADSYTKDLCDLIEAGQLRKRLDKLAKDGRSVPLSWELLFKQISEKIDPSNE
jgi:tetratricopeptide (TPR) repeat protein